MKSEVGEGQALKPELPDDDGYYDDGAEPECHTCAGEGYIEANEAYGDWINYGDELVRCPNCKGTGLRKDCSYF